MISGVGPKIEGILNELGVYQFEQVAKWKKFERDWVDDNLKFKGALNERIRFDRPKFDRPRLSPRVDQRQTCRGLGKKPH